MENTQTITVLDDFLSPEECQQIIDLAGPQLQPSTVWDVREGVKKQNDYRVSEQVHIDYSATPLVRAIERRIADFVRLSLDTSEKIQAVHYNVGGYYKEHWDYFDPALPGNRAALMEGGQRTTTFMVYLNDVEEGGSTYFPRISFRGIPKQGRALVWNNINEDSTVNPATYHVAEPVVRGEKWIFTKWFREKKCTNYPLV